MDCEKFESTLLDELYDELDEVTSAAAKRHVAGCARCAALFSGLKATRRLAVLPIVEPPADLEDRILAAAKEAQKVVPIGRRMSLAGSWAMRPQSAMAALFLVMIGTSALLIKGKVAKPPSSTMIVSEQGEPVASAAADTVAIAAPQGPADNGVAKDSKTASAAATAAASALAPNGYASGGDSPVDGLLARAPRAKAAEDKPKGLLDDLEEGSRGGGGGASPPPPSHYATGLGHAANLQQGPGAPQSAPAPPSMPAPQAAQAPAAQALGGLGGLKKDESNAPAEKSQQTPPTDFDNAMIAYNAGDYATAAQLWDNGARNGDLNAALWEARSVRESSGCGTAAPRFDRVAQQAGVSAVANDAMFDAARCYRALGQYDAARARLNQLLLVPSYINRAQNELNAMGPKAAAKARAPNAAGAQQQQQAPAAPPPAATQNSY